ncbi:hypothetical protein [Catenovulum sediminis]|uniref:Uncharacterized protein n=1 Tax=Catenovulum sediminis TaxID=1740262 RepID=A0ABV1RHU2_9ALTE|nr:hypothetical protein [Catenovulum sediminis]
MQDNAPHIGIFWLYKSTVVAKKTQLSQLLADHLAIYDSDFSHMTEWEDKLVFLPMFPELLGSEYQEIARGRIVYIEPKGVFRIYADKSIMQNANYRALVIDSFGLTGFNCLWLADPHYRVFKC